MKQVLQDLAGGECVVSDVPVPTVKRGHLLIRTRRTLISAGTERSLVEFGRAGYITKARRQPEKVKMVLDKVRTDGLLTTVEAVRAKLDEPIPMGYSNVGVVAEVGAGVERFQVGDRVLSNGPHADYALVPENLCVRIPDGVSNEDAVFGIVGSIGLQGIRLLEPTLGETFVVTGLGLIGLISGQILRANGCRVIGLDLESDKLDLAEELGIETVRLDEGQDPVAEASRMSGGVGVDGVLITASSKSDAVMHQAATMCRKRGRIVLVGVVGLNLRRSDFYEKELTFQVSCSYGPGRYDPRYEEGGQDYPLPFVRWTENRNMAAVLDLIDGGSLKVSGLVSARFPLADAPDAYDFLLNDRSALGVVLTASESAAPAQADRIVALGDSAGPAAPGKGVIGAIGAGNYAGRILLPAFKEAGARLRVIASSRGQSSDHVGRKLGFESNTTDVDAILEDDGVDTVVIATRHDSHAGLVIRALDAGKHVFVEKPLGLAIDDLDRIAESRMRCLASGRGGRLMIGFNRRFSPYMRAVKRAVEASSFPMSIIYTCNAGAIARDSWVHDPSAGGGRILGEACHFIDAARHLAGSAIEEWSVSTMSDAEGLGDTATISLGFANGSIAAIHYFANGDRSFPKERIEVFQGGRIMTLDNFRTVKGFGVKLSGRGFGLSQDKGQKDCARAFIESIRSGGPDPIPFDELIEVSRISIEVANASAP